MYNQNPNLQLIELKKNILNYLNDLQSQEIICIDIDKKYSITDLMIICTGQTNRHVISIAQDLSYKLRNIGFKFCKIEGLKNGEWVLIDLGDIIINIMQKNTRKLYALEEKWG